MIASVLDKCMFTLALVVAVTNVSAVLSGLANVEQ